MNLLQDFWGVIVETAEMMGRGEGFMIILWTYLFMVVVERLISAVVEKRVWHDRDSLANVMNGTFVAIVGALVTGGLFMGAYVFLYQHARVWDVPFVWWGWVLVFLLNDLAYYTDHRMSHRTGFFWALHTTHHSSREINFLVANRANIFQLDGLTSIAIFALPLLGVHPAMFLAVKFFANLWGIFNHTRLVKRMGLLEELMITPANHRVHHGNNLKYLDRNYAQVLSIWDRMFGTFQREEEEPTFGLVKQMESLKIWDIQTWGFQQLFASMRSAPRWQDKLRYLIKPPGWSHDGRHETTEAMWAQQSSLHNGVSNSLRRDPTTTGRAA
jgi:sterol desaturase/sphingolipid hydroxylase (fatty acid hydroxylase superfamily)